MSAILETNLLGWLECLVAALGAGHVVLNGGNLAMLVP